MQAKTHIDQDKLLSSAGKKQIIDDVENVLVDDVVTKEMVKNLNKTCQALNNKIKKDLVDEGLSLDYLDQESII